MKEPQEMTANARTVPLVPRLSGKPLTWAVTIVHTLSDSYASHTSCSAGTAAELAAS